MTITMVSEEFKSLLSYCFWLLGKRDYSEKGIRLMMGKKQESEEVINSVIKYLILHKYIDDRRFAITIIDSYKNYRGKNWIKQKMMLKHVNREIIDEVFEVEENWQAEIDYKVLLKTVKQKYKFAVNLSDLDWEQKGKIYRFLQGRGYTNVSDVFNKLELLLV
jgi:regulatory protein